MGNWWRTSQAYCTLCALAAIGAFLYMAFTIEPRLSPSQGSVQNQIVAASKQATNSTPENATQDVTTSWLVIATFALAFVAAVQAGLFIWQLILIRRSMGDTKRAADAAAAAANAATRQAKELRRSADATEGALTDLERPWIFVEGAKVNMERSMRPLGPPLPNDWFITLRLRNVGRMPALMSECVFKIEEKAKLPRTPDHQNAQLLSCPAAISVNRTAETGAVGPVPRNPNQLGFYGRISYRELNGKTHYTGFALEVSPHIPAFVGHANDTYYYHS
jgi:hypothetical protein